MRGDQRAGKAVVRRAFSRAGHGVVLRACADVDGQLRFGFQALGEAIQQRAAAYLEEYGA